MSKYQVSVGDIVLSKFEVIANCGEDTEYNISIDNPTGEDISALGYVLGSTTEILTRVIADNEYELLRSQSVVGVEHDERYPCAMFLFHVKFAK